MASGDVKLLGTDLPGCSACSDPTGRRASGDKQRVSITTDMDHNPEGGQIVYFIGILTLKYVLLSRRVLTL